MSKQARPSSHIHTFGAPYATDPGSIALHPQAHIILPSYHSAWSAPTIVYLTLALTMLFTFWWSVSSPRQKNQSDDSIVKTLFFGFYLFIGLVIAMALSHNKQRMYGWFVVMATLAPAVFVLFWITYHYQFTSTGNSEGITGDK